jgi:putative transposase
VIVTIQIKLLPSRAQGEKLREAVECFNRACNWLSEKVAQSKCTDKFKLHKLFYREIRDRFLLPADMSIRVIAQVCDTFKRRGTATAFFRPDAAVPYSYGRNCSLRPGNNFSISVMPKGRVLVPFVMGNRQWGQFRFAKGQGDLVCRKDGKWFLLLTAYLPDEPEIQPRGHIGVDFGLVNIATTSTGRVFSGAQIERRWRQKIRFQKTFQRRNTRGSRKRLRKASGRYHRFSNNVTHCVSKTIVAEAKALGMGLVIEDLTGIQERREKTVSKALRRRMSAWAYSRLRSCIAYKAKLAGVPLVVVPARNTSNTCSRCGNRDRASRKNRNEFVCVSCGYVAHADQNAAENLARLGANVNRPDLVPAPTNSSA